MMYKEPPIDAPATLWGSGRINANVINSGVVHVGGPSATGTLMISGNYTQDVSGLLRVEIGGGNPGSQFDVMMVTGQASLDGTLTAELINGFNPPAGSTYTFLTVATRLGDFTNKNLPEDIGIIYNPTDLTFMA